MMAYSNDWDNIYNTNKHMSIWPWSDLISLFKRHVVNNGNIKVCELGCGSGANIPFFLNEQCDYHAVEGSKYMVDGLIKKYPILKNKIICSDFTNNIPFDTKFDVIIDRASITHNSTSSIQKTLIEIKKKLKAKGKFIGVDWFSTEFSEYNNGQPTYDRYTKKGFVTGKLKDTGTVHFCDKQHIQELFSEFEIEYLVHNKKNNHVPDDYIYASWNIVAKV